MGRAYPIELTNMCMLRRADGKVLVQNRVDPNWGGLTFPGGHVEPGESLVDSVVREMREETGLTVLDPRLIGSKSWMKDDGSRYLVLLYTATEYEGELHSSEEGEISWMTIDEMRAGQMVDGMDLYFRVYLDGDVNEIWYEREGDGWIEMLK
ncbi:MAG: 8-oxo-dGTP diphosphatase [Clostridia bacterium]|nr:8-oxo-dGTP diphosphatase [Clostridia bacterium]